jgi:hypothetical protein
MAAIMSGQTKYIKLETHDAIMAVGLSATQGATRGKIGSEQSEQYIEEILLAGYSKGWICRQLGFQRSNNLKLSRSITAAKAAKIKAIHDRLWLANERGWKVLSGNSPRIYGHHFREVCQCYGTSDLQLKRQKDAEKQRQIRERKRQVC